MNTSSLETLTQVRTNLIAIHQDAPGTPTNPRVIFERLKTTKARLERETLTSIFVKAGLPHVTRLGGHSVSDMLEAWNTYVNDIYYLCEDEGMRAERDALYGLGFMMQFL